MKGLNFRFEKKKPEDKPLASVTEAEEIDTAGQTETFWTRNVRLLTFLICVAVFLVAFGPYSVFRISSCIAENRLEGEEMTVMDVWDLAQIREIRGRGYPLLHDRRRRYVSRYGGRTLSPFAAYLFYSVAYGQRSHG